MTYSTFFDFSYRNCSSGRSLKIVQPLSDYSFVWNDYSFWLNFFR